MEIILGIIGLFLTLVFGILTYVIKERKFRRNDDGFYYYKDKPKTLFCPKCYEEKNRKVILPDEPRICKKCKYNFQRIPYVHIIKASGPKYRIK